MCFFWPKCVFPLGEKGSVCVCDLCFSCVLPVFLCGPLCFPCAFAKDWERIFPVRLPDAFQAEKWFRHGMKEKCCSENRVAICRTGEAPSFELSNMPIG